MIRIIAIKEDNHQITLLSVKRIRKNPYNIQLKFQKNKKTPENSSEKINNITVERKINYNTIKMNYVPLQSKKIHSNNNINKKNACFYGRKRNHTNSSQNTKNSAFSCGAHIKVARTSYWMTHIAPRRGCCIMA